MRPLIWIFAISCVLRVWFNLFACPQNAAFACDAAEYLRHAQNILTAFNSFLADFPHSFTACLNILFNHTNVEDIKTVKQIFSPLQSMSISGPVFPLFILISFKIFGQNPSLQCEFYPIIIQSIVSALTCVLIAAIGKNCWSKPVGILSGLIAAFYPGFIINSGRLYSETFACFLLCTIIWIFSNYLVKSKFSYLWFFILGVCLFSLQTTRSVMSIISLVIIIFFVISSLLITNRKKQISKLLLVLIAGFLVCLLPWLALQKLAFGKASFIVDRVGQYNFFVGNDVDEFGWLSIPYPALQGIEKEKYSEILASAIKKSPERFIKLMMDKPARLLKAPWNDFKSEIGPISLNFQTIFHQLLLALAGVGLITAFVGYHQCTQRSKILMRSAIIFVGFFHLIYLLFITVPRYGLTAMPEIILFAAVGLVSLSSTLEKLSTRQFALKVIFAIICLLALSQMSMLLFLSDLDERPRQVHFWLYLDILAKTGIISLFLLTLWHLAIKTSKSTQYIYASISLLVLALLAVPTYCLPVRANGRWYEWSKDFNNKDSKISRTVLLDQTQIHNLINSQSYLALNVEGGSNLSQDWQLSINEHVLSGPFIPAMSLAQDLTLVHKDNNTYSIEQESILKSLCNVLSISPLDLRQWYLIPLQASDLAPDLIKNGKITLEAKKDNTSTNTIYGAYNCSKSFSIIPSLFRFSWEKAFYSVENQKGLSDAAYDQKIAINHTPNPAGPYIKLLIPKNLLEQLPLSQQKLFKNDPVFSKHQLTLIENKKSKADLSKDNIVLTFKINSLPILKSASAVDYWLVRFSGVYKDNSIKTDLKALSKQNGQPKRLILWPVLNFSQSALQPSDKTYTYASPWVPQYLDIPASQNNEPLHFDFCFPILRNAFNEPLQTLDLNILEQRHHAEQNKIGEQKQLQSNIECSLQIYRINKLLPGIQYEIF